ncbi:DUF2332 domain-containing protein [Loktanella sp. D2R18]|uniref:DUF2332 domain-containing protein n=1 Tax=Rhodobacterales TaxID=204455 RepID=UPI000DE990AE|nr:MULTISPECIES: DUF2332 family protein [Rhodobacterales]MDO6589290.1 DUF2332 family protein [Yoonia sp. 1_MG-2023]RBW45287.1 DUF2332 domain-containing protein [Loktanella sp. D2R18]
MIPEHVKDAFTYQATACAGLGSPFMAQLMTLCATRDWPACAVTDRIFGWQGNLHPSGQSVPLRLAGALHACKLAGDPTLTAVYPPVQTSDDTLWTAVCDTLINQKAAINAQLDHAPQTNEVRRSAVLIAVGHLLADRFHLPIRLSELGASAGLNLHWDHYGLEIADAQFGATAPALTLRPDWAGPPPPSTAPNVTARAGVDLNPLDPKTDAQRLQSYLWADQPERITLTRAAIAAAKTPVTQGDAIDWLEDQLGHTPGQLHLIYSTVAWQYFPTEKQVQGAAMIAQAGRIATKDSPLAWFTMEGDSAKPGAALTLRLWPGDLTIPLGLADFHGRWIQWSGE